MDGQAKRLTNGCIDRWTELKKKYKIARLFMLQ